MARIAVIGICGSSVFLQVDHFIVLGKPFLRPQPFGNTAGREQIRLPPLPEWGRRYPFCPRWEMIRTRKAAENLLLSRG